VVARCRNVGLIVGGNTASEFSPSGPTPLSLVEAGPFAGEGLVILDFVTDENIFHERGVSSATTSSESSRVRRGRFGRIMLSCG
jgi:hypothetical protein